MLHLIDDLAELKRMLSMILAKSRAKTPLPNYVASPVSIHRRNIELRRQQLCRYRFAAAILDPGRCVSEKTSVMPERLKRSARTDRRR